MGEVMVEAEAPNQRLDRTGFYRRKQMGFGRFLTREDIERRMLMYPTDLFDGLVGARVGRGRLGGGHILNSRSGCLMTVVLDGMIVIDGGCEPGVADLSIDDLVSVEAIEAVEVQRYHPRGLNVKGSGVVLIWTRLGGTGN